MAYRKIFNWSRTKSCYAKILYPKTYLEISNILKQNKEEKSFSFKASGGSYGDCFLNDKGTIVDLNNFNQILNLNKKNKTIVVQCGVKIQSLLNYLMPKGFYLNSIPGFNEATVGGCINSNVHGKDAHLEGVFGNNVLSLKVMNSLGEIFNIQKGNKNFSSAIGFYGLSFIILEAKLKIIKTNSTLLKVDTLKFSNYQRLFDLFKKYEKTKFPLMGAWINHFDNDGSGIFKAAKWHKEKTKKFKKINLLSNVIKKFIITFIYPFLNIFFINRFVIKHLNFLLYKFSNNNKKISHYSDFYFPQQKFLPEESKLYGGGKINIQILIPQKEVLRILRSINKLCNFYKMESWWLGIKKHKNDKFIFSYALDGYDITLQWSKNYTNQEKFKYFYKKLLNLVIKNRCLIYLTQDVLLSKKEFKKIYKNYKKFNKIKLKLDPKLKFKNNLFRRLLS